MGMSLRYFVYALTIAIYYYYSAWKQLLILPSRGGCKLESTGRHCKPVTTHPMTTQALTTPLSSSGWKMWWPVRTADLCHPIVTTVRTCLVAPCNVRITLVPCSHQRFCDVCADQVHNLAHCCPICQMSNMYTCIAYLIEIRKFCSKNEVYKGVNFEAQNALKLSYEHL